MLFQLNNLYFCVYSFQIDCIDLDRNKCFRWQDKVPVAAEPITWSQWANAIDTYAKNQIIKSC